MPDLRKAILTAQLSVEGGSPRRLGLVVSLAFRRFVRLYHKYSDDQPRDEQGALGGDG